MNTSLTTATQVDLFSKAAIQLCPKKRLELLLCANNYPIVKKKTSAIRQLKEMIDFYNLCCIQLTQFFPTESSENNYEEPL